MNIKAKKQAATVLTLDEQIAQLLSRKEKTEAVQALVAAELEAIRALNANTVNAKNVNDAATADKGTMWGHTFSIIEKIHDATQDNPEDRYQLFTDAMDEFLNLPADAEGNKPKATTASMYASTGRKLLVEVVTDQGKALEEFADKSYKEVREAFKDTKDAALLSQIGEAAKQLRYVVKHGTTEEKAELEGLFSLITEAYNPVKARKDASSTKALADATLRDDAQQAPNEGTTVETVAGELAGDESEEEGHGLKVAVG